MKRKFLSLYLVYVAVVLEIGSRLIYRADVLFKGIDEVTCRRAWIQRHDAQIEIYYGFDRYDPTKGWAIKPNLSGLEVFDHKHLTTNSRGIRGPEYSYDKPLGKKRILVLGDSFTFGDEIGDEETYPYFLQKLMPATDVINLGVHGYGHDQMLIHFEEEGAKYHPDIVLLGFIGNDMPRNRLAFRDYAKPRFELSPGGLKLTNQPVPPPESVLADDRFRSRFLDLIVLLRHKLVLRYSPSVEQEKTDRLTAAILDELAAAVQHAGAKLILVQLPDAPDFAAQSPTNTFFDRYCASTAVTCISLYAFAQSEIAKGRPLVFEQYGHLSADGNRMVAEGIRDNLVESGFF